MLGIKLGIDYCKNQTVNGKPLYDILKNYQIPASWHDKKQVECLDELELFDDEMDGYTAGQSPEVQCHEAKASWCYTNTDFKWDLEDLMHTGSCSDLASYIFALILEIQNMAI